MERSAPLRTSCAYHQPNASSLSLTCVTSFIIFILDWIGRKKPLVFGAGSFVVLFSVLAALVASFPPGENPNLAAQKAAIAMIFMTSIIFSLSFGPVSWVLASEVSQTDFQHCAAVVLTECISGVPHPDAVHWHERCYVRELVIQCTPFRNVTDRDGQHWMEILPDIRLFERSGLYCHHSFLPRNKRHVPPEPSWLCTVLTSWTGKSLEEMAVIFGDEIDAKRVLQDHIGEKEDHFGKA